MNALIEVKFNERINPEKYQEAVDIIINKLKDDNLIDDVRSVTRCIGNPL
jgi:hypothetical protein